MKLFSPRAIQPVLPVKETVPLFKKAVFFAVWCLFALVSVWGASPLTDREGEAYNHYLKALLQESQGNLVNAGEELDQALQVAPESAYLRRTAAELAFRLGQFKKASHEIEKAIELDANNYHVFILAGQIYWAQGLIEEAKQRFEKAVELGPNEAEPLMNLAMAVTPDDPKRAIELYEKYLERHPSEAGIEERVAQLYQSLGNLAGAEGAWKKVLEWSPDSMRAHLALAQIAEVSFDTATAIGYYEAVLSRDPSNLPLLLRVGELRYRNDEMGKAYEAFAKAQTIAPESTSASFWMALLSERRGEWDLAIQYLEQVAEKVPDPGVLLRLSYYYTQANRPKKGIEVLRKVYDSDPENIDFLNYLTIAYEQDKQYQKAIKLLKKRVDIDPTNPEPYFYMATLYDRLHQFKKTEEALKKAIELDPDYHVALNYLGYSYADRNIHLKEAEKLINDAVALDPGNGAYLDSMGWILYREGKYQKAEDFLRQSTLKTRDPLIWEHLGDVQTAKGDVLSALLSWDESMRINSSQKKLQAKINKSMRKLAKKDLLKLFFQRSIANFGDVESIHGLLRVKIKPKFETSAQFQYERRKELRVEVPGPLSGPAMLLIKPHGKPTKYGAIHPLFQSVEYYVTRAFERIEPVLSAGFFRHLHMADLEKNIDLKRGKVRAHAQEVDLLFNRKDGTLKSIEWRQGRESDVLTLSHYDHAHFSSIPDQWRWEDKESKFSITMTLVNPVVTVSPPEEE